MIKELSQKIHSVFATDQYCYLSQQDDGTYRKKYGSITPMIIRQAIEKSGSIAIYQKTSDSFLRWICFDFDVLKKHVNADSFDDAFDHLKKVIKSFCTRLEHLTIPYLLEYSGNRGFHVWVTFSDPIPYSIGYDILDSILNNANLSYEKDLIGIDLFPHSKIATDGVGKGVKIPLSLHKKSNCLSVLLESKDAVDGVIVHTELNSDLVKQQVQILDQYTPTTLGNIEKSMGRFFLSGDLNDEEYVRIKYIKIKVQGFELPDLFSLWEKVAPLNYIKEKLINDAELSNEERKLLVGLIGNIQLKDHPQFSKKILHEIFSKTNNYNETKTEIAITSLSSFNFPSQSQIENITGEKFDEIYPVETILNLAIPNYVSYKAADFEFCRSDVEITRIAEVNYIFQNDEVCSRKTLNKLESCSNDRLLHDINHFMESEDNLECYKHVRKEEEKDRILISLDPLERIFTSCVIKQLLYFYDFPFSPNSFGYQVNNGYRNGYIFKPWLYQWIKFVSNISSNIEDTENKSCYVVKTDIQSFYDSISHDNLKRLLLGKLNPKIDSKVSRLKNHKKDQYMRLVTSVFDITKKVMNSDRGLPQGPAYARILAEIYLDTIDQFFDEKLFNGELIFYNRYVDDIFFITDSEQKARETLSTLRKNLEIQDLTINEEKTIISRISNFTEDFNKYRSQSKYAVDKVSKKFDNATETEKEMALSEFINLIQSDSCNDDLSFIFSHLAGVDEIKEFKKDKILPTLKSGVGRGSLFKHLFQFILENRDLWGMFDEIDTFTELQSEVLTSTILNFLEEPSSQIDINSFLEKIIPKLSQTKLVQENLVYFAILYDAQIDFSEVNPLIVAECIAISPDPEGLFISPKIVKYLNTTLNDIKCLADFTDYLYPLCCCQQIETTELNSLSKTFYAKIAEDYKLGCLNTDYYYRMKVNTTVSKFYYLVCLFSLSDENTSELLLKEMWRLCINLSDLLGRDSIFQPSHSWYDQLPKIGIDNNKAFYILSSILDGIIVRGPLDRNKIFEYYHSIVFIYIALKVKEIEGDQITDILERLSSKNSFYEWIVKRSGELFPNKNWFEKNLIRNECIIIKNENKILIRKPKKSFLAKSFESDDNDIYGQIIADYNVDKMISFKDALNGSSLLSKLQTILSIIDYCIENQIRSPNLFSVGKLLNKENLKPFSNELFHLDYILFETETGSVENRKNNVNNFIKYFFQIAFSDDQSHWIKHLNETYIEKLDSNKIDVLKFIRNTVHQLNEITEVESYFYLDISIAAALYLSLLDSFSTLRIEMFVDQYYKFAEDDSDRYIFCVDKTTVIDNSNPSSLLNTIQASIETVIKSVLPSSSLFLANDIELYHLNLQKLSTLEGEESPPLKLEDFKKCLVRVQVISQIVDIAGTEFKFPDIFILDVVSNSVNRFESKYITMLNSSEHIYFYPTENRAYLVVFPSAFSKMFISIKNRHEAIILESSENKSYPDVIEQTDEIIKLSNFDNSVDIISQHKGVESETARAMLIKWLKSIPKKYHKALTNLIAAHEVMKKDEIDNFILKVKDLIDKGDSNPFLIKKIGDYNGTHRILFSNNELGRKVDELGPETILDGAERATIIVDNTISGSQITKALNYYINNKGRYEKYYEYDSVKADKVAKILENLKTIDLCVIFYTEKAKERIIEFYKKALGKDIVINVIFGRDISENAYFKTTRRLGLRDKSELLELFENKIELEKLCENHLNLHPNITRKLLTQTEKDILKRNLIARYQSMPKRSFEILNCGLKFHTECSPFNRVLELYEKERV